MIASFIKNAFQYWTADFNNAKAIVILHKPNIYVFGLTPPVHSSHFFPSDFPSQKHVLVDSPL